METLVSYEAQTKNYKTNTYEIIYCLLLFTKNNIILTITNLWEKTLSGSLKLRGTKQITVARISPVIKKFILL